MDRNVKIVLIAAVVVLVVASAVFFLYPRDSEEPTVLEVKIIGFDSYGNFALDVTEEQLHGMGADIGYEVYLDIRGERVIAMHSHDWNGLPHGMLFLSYTVSTGEMVLGLYNASLKDEMKLEVGDTMKLWYKGPSKYYDSLNKYLQPFSGQRSDYDSDEIFANFRELKGGSMKEDLIYRSASPWTTKDERTYYVNKLCEKEGIESLVLLDISYDALAKLIPESGDLYCNGIFDAGNVSAASFHPAVLSNTKDIEQFLRMFDESEGKVCIACKYGKDRTGSLCAMLQALAGASYEEICEEFMKSMTNYYGIEKGSEEYVAVESIYIRPFLYTMQHPEIIGHYHDVDWDEVDFQPFEPYEVVYKFLTEYVGMDHELIDRIIEKITV